MSEALTSPRLKAGASRAYFGDRELLHLGIA